MSAWMTELFPLLALYLGAGLFVALAALYRGRGLWRSILTSVVICLGSFVVFIAIPIATLTGMARLSLPFEALVLVGLPLIFALQIGLPMLLFRLLENRLGPASPLNRLEPPARRETFEILDYQTGEMIQVDAEGNRVS